MVVVKEYDDGVLVRTAHMEDKEGVCEIEGFGDFDYMTHMYDHYMENQSFTGFLAESNGKVVAFCYTYLVDDGKTIIWGGKRVHQDFQGQGHLSKLTSAAEDYTSGQHPDVSTWRYSALWDEFNQKKYVPKLQEQGALIQLAIRNLIGYDSSLGHLRSLPTDSQYKTLCADYDVGNVETVTDTDTIPLGLLDPSVQRDLFPDNLLIVLWEPYRPLASNLQYIMHTSQCNITSSGDKVAAATFLSHVISPKSTVRFDVEIYVSGALTEAEQWFHLKQHIIKSLIYKWPELSDDTNCTITYYCPKAFHNPKTRAWLSEHFQGLTASQRKQVHLSDQYIACDYDRTKLKKS